MTQTALPLHTQIANFQVDQNEIVIGGRRVSEIAAELGEGPFFVYDSQLIRERIAHMRKHLPEELHLHYAIKANPMPEVVNLISPLVDGLDIASVLELDVALDTDTSPKDISFAGPGKRVAELEQAVASGISVTIESTTEMQRLIAIGEQQNCRPRVAIRVNPDFELKTSGMKMSGGPKQFGVDAEQVPAMLKAMTGSNLHLVGMHIFCGSQNLKADALIDVQNKTYELAQSLMQQIDHELEWLNLGGGFGIPYFKGDKPLDLAPLGANLVPIVNKLKAFSPSTQLVLELGRYIVGEAGIYICQIVDRKISRDHVFLVADGGLHHHLAASGNFGQIIRKNYPVLIANKVFSDDPEIQTVVGPLCTPLDLLADRMSMARGEIGDYVAVFQSGAYGPTSSPINFLSHPLPKEILV